MSKNKVGYKRRVKLNKEDVKLGKQKERKKWA